MSEPLTEAGWADAIGVSCLNIGTRVLVGGDIEGEIVALEIRGCSHLWNVNYEVAWWNGRQREKQWLTEQEVRWTVAESVKAGFRRNP